jgi:hypothetical protein
MTTVAASSGWMWSQADEEARKLRQDMRKSAAERAYHQAKSPWMTVADLVAILNKFPPHLPVVLGCEDDQWMSEVALRPVNVIAGEGTFDSEEAEMCGPRLLIGRYEGCPD